MVIQSRNPNTRLIYEFIKSHRNKYPVEVMCQELEVAQSGYYAWLQKPVSDRALEDSRLLVLIRASYKQVTEFMVLAASSWISVKPVKHAACTGSSV
jgi:hypothetical protein